MPQDWSSSEIDAIVSDYFTMLRAELRGADYSKTQHRRALATQLNNRTDGSIEFKHQNISAVLSKHRFRHIRGYKPKANLQGILEHAVLDYLRRSPELAGRLRES